LLGHELAGLGGLFLFLLKAPQSSNTHDRNMRRESIFPTILENIAVRLILVSKEATTKRKFLFARIESSVP